MPLPPRGLFRGLAPSPAFVPEYMGSHDPATTSAALVSSPRANGRAMLLPFACNVEAFGARGDGIADDTQAIQDAVAAVTAAGGGVVFFPAGVYSINQTIVVAHSGVELVGSGHQATAAGTTPDLTVGTWLLWNGATTGIMVHVRPAGSGASEPGNTGFRFSNLGLHGNYKAAIGLQLISTQEFVVERFLIVGCCYVSLDMNCMSDNQSAGSRNVQYGVVRNGSIFNYPSGSVVASAVHTITNGTDWNTIGTITTSSTITADPIGVPTNGDFPTVGLLLLWALQANGNYVQILCQYTGLNTGASGSFTGVSMVGGATQTPALNACNGFSPWGTATFAGADKVVSASNAAGLTTVQRVTQGAGMGVRLDGNGNSNDTTGVVFDQVHVNQGNSPALTCIFTDHNVFRMFNANRSDVATYGLHSPGFVQHGTTLAAGAGNSRFSRGDQFSCSNGGDGGFVAYGSAQGSIEATAWGYANIPAYTQIPNNIYLLEYGPLTKPYPYAGTGATIHFTTDGSGPVGAASFSNLGGAEPGTVLNYSSGANAGAQCVVVYNPTTQATIAATTALTALDTTNLVVGPFTYPPSGQVDLTLEAEADAVSATTAAAGWFLQWQAFSSTNSASLGRVAVIVNGNAGNVITAGRYRMTIRCVGTPGAEDTVQWRQAISSAPTGASANTRYGGTAANFYGAARMEVRAA